jgi:hypothetical protein
MSKTENSSAEKHIIINPNLFAHNLKNSRTRKSKDNYEDDNSGGGGHENHITRKPKIKMRNNDGIGGVGNKTRYSRKSILRQYRQKQEEINNDSGILTSFSESGGNTKLFIDTPQSSGNRNVAEEESEFKESVNFFKNLEKNVSEGKNVHGGRLDIDTNHRHTVKKAPEYGCLKSGNLPTYRQWNGGGVGTVGGAATAVTRKVSLQVPDSPLQIVGGGHGIISVPMTVPGGSYPIFAQNPPILPMPTVHIPHSTMPSTLASSHGGGTGGTSFVPPLYTESEKLAQQRAKEIYENMRAKENQMMGGGIRDTEDSELKIKKQKKTIMRKLTTGISKKNRNNSEEPGKVSILIPNKTIRKRVDNMKHEIHQTPIQEVKKYLLKHGFIKIGSPAPNDVLRKIYEDLLVLGDVYNRNGENIVYNFKLGSSGDK